MLSQHTLKVPLISLLVLITAFSIPVPQGLSQTPDEKPRRIKKEPNRVFKDWARKEVALIITPDELKAYEKLATDEEREQFIIHFWEIRDPSPDTEENEYKDEFYERTRYADERFSSGKPGRLTDRGRIYIKFGKPDGIESYPAGGPYQRLPHEGGGSTTTYPFERWFYRYIENVGSDIEIEFVDPTGTGEYRIARNLNEKDALLHVPGAGPTLAEELGLNTKAERVAAAFGFGSVNHQRYKDSPFEVLGLHNELDKVADGRRNYFGSTTDRPTIDDNFLNFEVQTHFFRQSDNQVLTAITIQAANKDLVFASSGGVLMARLNIAGRIFTIAQRPAGKFEDSVAATALPTELVDARQRLSAYGKAVVLPPGRYRLDVMVRDVESGAMGIRNHGFEVPRYKDGQLATSSIVLAAKLEDLAGRVAAGPLVIGKTKVVPNLTGDYVLGQPVGVYLQAYNVGIDQTTLKPAVEVSYVVSNGGKEISVEREDWRAAADPGPRLTLTRLIDTGSFEPGEYEITIRIRDQVSGQTHSPAAKFRLVRAND